MFIIKNIKHKGIQRKRLKHNILEKTLADDWEDLNKKRSYISHGFGILQDLMVITSDKRVHNSWSIKGFSFVITQRDAVIVATIIQWLGTNVGMCFLEKALGKAGYKIIQEKPLR